MHFGMCVEITHLEPATPFDSDKSPYFLSVVNINSSSHLESAACEHVKSLHPSLILLLPIQ